MLWAEVAHSGMTGLCWEHSMVTVGMQRTTSISRKVNLEDSPLMECTDSHIIVKTGRAFLLSSAPTDPKNVAVL